jgi:large subunit ribosomal protein LP2
MQYVVAYLLAQLGGKADPSSDDIKDIVSAAGVKADSTRADALVSTLKGKSIESLIAQGRSKLASVAAAAPAAASSAAAASAPAAAPAAPAKEAKKKEESADEDMGLGLFD